MPAPAIIHPTTGKPVRSAPAHPRPRAGLSGDFASAFPYDASNVYGRETEGWYPRVYSPDYEIDTHRDRMVGRSRDLRRNDGWVSGGLQRILDGTIGAHWRLSAKPDYRALSQVDPAFDSAWAMDFRLAAEAKFRNFADDPNFYCDATRQLNFTQLMRLALSHKLVDGEDIIVLDWMPERVGYGGAHYATAIRIVDPDRLSNPSEMIDTLHRRGGVQIDEDGAPVGYHIRQAHQNDWYGAVESMMWDFFPRETDWGRPIVIHDYDRERADQHRGVPLLVPVMSRMKMLAKYDQVELQAAVLNAILSIAVKSPMDPDGLRDTANAGDEESMPWYWDARRKYRNEKPLQMSEAQVLSLFPGEEVEAIQSQRPGSAHDPFTSYVLRGTASQMGTTAEQLTQDWSKINYSSARAAVLEARKTIKRRIGDFSANTSNRIYSAWLEEAMDNGEMPMPKSAKSTPDFVEFRAAFSRCSWLGVGAGWIDPVKEAQASVLRMDAGISTLQQECAEQGLDRDENLDEREFEVKEFKRRGLPLPEWAGVDASDAAQKPPKPEAQ